MSNAQPEGFLAEPAAGSGPGVLVLHAWWGLNDTIKAFCTRLSEAGFTAFAPDLYHGKVVTSIPDAEAAVEALDANSQQAAAEVAEAARNLYERVGPADRERGLTVIGFSLGAFYALSLSADDPERVRSVVLFYGTGGADFSSSKAAYLGHFAGNDPFEPPENVAELEQYLKSLGRPVNFYTYPGTSHWFFEPDRPEYNPEAANQAWERTLAFLNGSK